MFFGDRNDYELRVIIRIYGKVRRLTFLGKPHHEFGAEVRKRLGDRKEILRFVRELVGAEPYIIDFQVRHYDGDIYPKRILMPWRNEERNRTEIEAGEGPWWAPYKNYRHIHLYGPLNEWKERVKAKQVSFLRPPS